MITPAHCTRTWPAVSVCAAYDTGTHRCAALDSYHHVQHVCDCGNVDVAARCTRTDPHMRHNVYDDAGMWLEVCPGVEPPADVAATPDPRLDYDPRRMVLAKVLQDQIPALTGMGAAEIAQYGLYALDDFAGAQAMNGPAGLKLANLTGAAPGLTGGLEPGEYLRRQYAPAGLTSAQEIRLRVFEASATDTELARMGSVAAWVEHGDDETPHDCEVTRALDLAAEYAAVLKQAETDRAVAYEAASDAHAAAAKAEARADLAEARLGHIADALAFFDGPDGDDLGTFLEQVRDALAWTPDDTATTDADATQATQDDQEAS